MRITENFRHPHDDNPTQVSVTLSDNKQFVVMDISRSMLTVAVEDIGTLIGMLQALQHRAAK